MFFSFFAKLSSLYPAAVSVRSSAFFLPDKFQVKETPK